MNKRILIFTIQPPPFQGVQGIRYYKLIKPLKEMGWDLHFVGPNPALASVNVLTTNTKSAIVNGHYINTLPLSRTASVKKHRAKGSTRYFWKFIQGVGVILEKLGLSPTYHDALKKGMFDIADGLLGDQTFDIIAGVNPSFTTLQCAQKVAKKYDTPFAAIYHDPHGGRDENRFEPADEAEQSEIIDHAVKVIFASSLTQERYIDAFNIPPEKVVHVSDSFIPFNEPKKVDTLRKDLAQQRGKINIVHLGNLSYWRPVEPLMEAMKTVYRESLHLVTFTQYGHIYPEVVSLIESDQHLQKIVNLEKEVLYEESKAIAESADIICVVIGPDHTDNVPSKVYEYLFAGKPILLLSPQNNPAISLIESLGIGEYCDVRNKDEIILALNRLGSDLEHYMNAYHVNEKDILKYSAQRVAKKWASIFNSI